MHVIVLKKTILLCSMLLREDVELRLLIPDF